MDFNSDLSSFQGALISADNVHSFCHLSAKGGYEEEFKFVLNKISSYLQEKYEDQTDGDKISITRKLALYLVLNTDLQILQKLVDQEGIDAVIWTIPSITKCLMCEMFWSFDFERFAYEIIVFCDPDLSIEVASSFLDSIKYLTPMNSLDKLEILVAACYRQIYRLMFYDLSENKLLDMLNKTYNMFHKLLCWFNEPPNSSKLLNLSKDEQYKHIGNSLYKLISLSSECLHNYCSTEELKDSNMELYFLTHLNKTLANKIDVSAELKEPISTFIEKCNLSLLDKCQEMVMSVTVDVFCAWSEFDEDNKSMQQIIGEQCYNFNCQIASIPTLKDHPILSMLQPISRKPADLDELINNMDNAKIINTIQNHDSANQKIWVKALLYKKKLCSNADLLQVLETHIHLLNDEELQKFYKILTNHLENNPENELYIQNLGWKVFKQCSVALKIEILKKHFTNNILYDTYMDDYDNMSTEIFNKLIASPHADMSVVLNLFILNPKNVFIKIFKLACESKQQCEIMLSVMNMLAYYSSYYYRSDIEPCAVKVCHIIIEEGFETSSKISNFINFAIGLKNTEFIQGNRMLLTIIMPNLHKYLLGKDINRINILVRLLSKCFTLDELLVFRAPMLAMVAQVLEVVRWKINSYNANSPSTIETSLDLLLSLTNTYQSYMPENEENWLKSKLGNLQPLNMYYYRFLWKTPGNNFIEVISGINLNINLDFDQLTLFLSQIICSTCQREWCDIWECLFPFGKDRALEILYKALAMVTDAEAENGTDQSWSCILFCFRNFSHILKEKYLQDTLTQEKVNVVVEKLTSLSKLLKEERMNEFETTFLPLFAYIAEKKNDNSLDINVIRDRLQQTTLSNIIQQVFSNGS